MSGSRDTPTKADASATGANASTPDGASPSNRRRATAPANSARLRPIQSSPSLTRRGTPTRLNPIASRTSMGDMKLPSGSFLKRPLPHLGKGLIEADQSLTRPEMDALLARRAAGSSPVQPSGRTGSPVHPAALQQRRRGSNLGGGLATIPLEHLSSDWAKEPLPMSPGRAAAISRTSRRKRSLLAITPPITAGMRDSRASAVTRDLSSFLRGQQQAVESNKGPATKASPPQPSAAAPANLAEPVPVPVAVSGGTHARGRNFLTCERDPSLRRNEIEDIANRLAKARGDGVSGKKQRRRSTLGLAVVNSDDLASLREAAEGEEEDDGEASTAEAGGAGEMEATPSDAAA